MLAVVALMAVLCAWYAHATRRADEQDAVTAMVQPGHGSVYSEPLGAEWLDRILAKRLRRRIVGVELTDLYRPLDEVDLFKRLARLPHLRYLDIEPVLLPTVEPLLGDMRQLRTLRIYCRSKPDPQAVTLEAVGKIAQLERLSVSIWVASERDLEQLGRLTRLKSLALEVRDEIDAREGLAALGKLPQLERLSLKVWYVHRGDLAWLAGLANLKWLTIQSTNEFLEVAGTQGPDGPEGALVDFAALARLEALELTGVQVAAADLEPLAACPRLKSLSLSKTGVGDDGLARFAAMQSLEELAIDEPTLTVAGIESISALKKLRALHITQVTDEDDESLDQWSSFVLDDGQELAIPASALDRLRHALEALRQRHPGFLIDTDHDGFREREFPDAFQITPPSDWQRGS
jgi:hypothetical protein